VAQHTRVARSAPQPGSVGARMQGEGEKEDRTSAPLVKRKNLMKPTKASGRKEKEAGRGDARKPDLRHSLHLGEASHAAWRFLPTSGRAQGSVGMQKMEM